MAWDHPVCLPLVRYLTSTFNMQVQALEVVYKPKIYEAGGVLVDQPDG